VLISVYLDLKALSTFLDPVLGQKMELGLCLERRKVREMILLGLSSFFAHSSLLSSHCEGAFYCDPKQGEGVELGL
jgi:hypothetical protein